MMLAIFHEIILGHCKGFLKFAGPSGGSITPHVQQNVGGIFMVSNIVMMMLWGLIAWIIARITYHNFRRCSWGVLSPLCEFTKFNMKK